MACRNLVVSRFRTRGPWNKCWGESNCEGGLNLKANPAQAYGPDSQQPWLTNQFMRFGLHPITQRRSRHPWFLIRRRSPLDGSYRPPGLEQRTQKGTPCRLCRILVRGVRIRPVGARDRMEGPLLCLWPTGETDCLWMRLERCRARQDAVRRAGCRYAATFRRAAERSHWT